MFTRQNYTSLTVGQSLDLLGLKDAKSGVAENNPEFLNVTVVDVQKAVVNRLSGKGIMVVLDNHVSKPEWCCGEKDGNGFFGDAFFDPEEWIQGLSLVAKLYKANTNVSPFLCLFLFLSHIDIKTLWTLNELKYICICVYFNTGCRYKPEK